MNGLPSSSPVSRTVTTCGCSPSLLIASASRRALASIAAPTPAVSNRATATSVPAEALHPVAAGDLGGQVGAKGVGRADLDRRVLGGQLGAAGVAESRPIAILVAAGRTPHHYD